MTNTKDCSKKMGEFYGMKSQCFEAKVRSPENGQKLPTNFCFENRCLENGNLEVKVGEKWHVCEADGQRIVNPGEIDGFLTCPKISDFCEQRRASCEKDCYLRGRCLMGNKCFCYEGFEGDFCGIVDGAVKLELESVKAEGVGFDAGAVCEDDYCGNGCDRWCVFK